MKTTLNHVYWTTFEHHEWMLYLAATEQGLCCITLPNEDFSTLELWVKKHVKGAVLLQDNAKMESYKRQLAEYFHGDREEFTCPLDFRGTPFQVQVWQTLTKIPYGEVKSYSDIADQIGHPKAVRAVGTANGANPIPIVVPCHRVIGKNGTLTGYSGGLEIKAQLLAFEGR